MSTAAMRSSSEQNPTDTGTACRINEKQIVASLQKENNDGTPSALRKTVGSSDEYEASANELRNQVKDSMQSPTPCKKQKLRCNPVKKEGASYSSLLSLMPSRMSLRTLITPQMVPLGLFPAGQAQTLALASSSGAPVLPRVRVATAEAINLAHCGKAHPKADKEGSHWDGYPNGNQNLDALTAAAGKEALREIQESECLSLSLIDATTNKKNRVPSANSVEARRFAMDVHAMQQAMRESDDPEMNAMNFKVGNLNEMATLAERLYDQQDIFGHADAVDNNGSDNVTNGPLHVDIGYVYTDKPSLDLLLEDGLVTRATAATGAGFGTGIYTANNPFAGHPSNYYGAETESIGLLVARLRGSQSGRNGCEPDSVVGRRNRPDEVVVFRSSSQCFPLVQYGSPLIQLNDDRSLGNDMVHQYHFQLQDIVDQFFNGGRSTPVPRVLAMQVATTRPQLVPN